MRPITLALLVGLLLAAVALAGLARIRDDQPPTSACTVPGGPYEIQMQLDGDWLPAGGAATQATATACIDASTGSACPTLCGHDPAPQPARRPSDGRRAE
jgi:hypothetical protein